MPTGRSEVNRCRYHADAFQLAAALSITLVLYALVASGYVLHSTASTFCHSPYIPLRRLVLLYVDAHYAPLLVAAAVCPDLLSYALLRCVLRSATHARSQASCAYVRLHAALWLMSQHTIHH